MNNIKGMVEKMAQQGISQKISRRRSLVMLGFFGVIALVLILSLVKLQVLEHDFYKQKVLNQLTVETEVNPERGTIYDANGNILASNITNYLVFISPQDIIDAMTEVTEKDGAVMTYSWTDKNGSAYSGMRQNEYISRFLSETLEVEYEKIMEKAAKQGRRYEVIKTDVPEESAEKIRQFISDNDFTSQIYLRATSKRYYPNGTLAAHVIGFTNTDGVGIYGLESYYNNTLEGTSGRYITAQDALNNDMPFEYESYIEAENGYNIVTTIDSYIQYELENQLEATMIESGAQNRVTGIVMDVKTGGVLGMATAPSFNPNDPYKLDTYSLEALSKYAEGTDEYNKEYLNVLFTMWKNKAITELYEPGSTFKIVTTAMALDEDVVKWEDEFFCSGSLMVEGYPKPISCHKTTGHGKVTFREGLQQSCNPTLMNVALRIGQERFYNYFKAFGYTAVSGIDLPGEAATIYHPYKDFTIPSLAVYSFGQTFKTTPLQQLSAIASVANGGYLVTPHLLKSVTDDEGNVIRNYETEVKRQVVSGDTCSQIWEVLEDGVSGNGGAKNAYVKGYKIAAKTGTSEKKDKKDEFGEFSYRLGSCVAFAPADDPQVAVIIIVDEPTIGSVYGSVVAAPYVANMMSFILPYLGYEPQYTEEELQKVEISISNYVGATVENSESDLSWRGIKYEIIGSGDTITAQVPPGGSTIMKDDGKLLLYAGETEPKAEVTVPNLIGKTAEASNRLLVNLGLNVQIVGATNGESATVISQSTPEGELVPKGTVIRIEMRHMEVSDDSVD